MENYGMQSSLNFSRKVRLAPDLLPYLAYLIVPSESLHQINTGAGAQRGSGESQNMIGQDPAQSDLCWACFEQGWGQGVPGPPWAPANPNDSMIL